MSKSVYDVNEEQKALFGTKNNKSSMFPVGTRVRIVCVAQDFRFFNGTETGTVVESADKTLSKMIMVDIDHKPNKKDVFNFDPEDLIVIDKVCPNCGHKLEA